MQQTLLENWEVEECELGWLRTQERRRREEKSLGVDSRLSQESFLFLADTVWDRKRELQEGVGGGQRRSPQPHPQLSQILSNSGLLISKSWSLPPLSSLL
jgi:hypothetical protein